MKKFNIKLIHAVLLLVILTVPAFAQRGGSIGGSSDQKPGLTVNCNVRNSMVEIKKAEKYAQVLASGTAPFTAQLEPGSYTVTVSAPGYETKEQSVNLRNSMTLNFNLTREQPVEAGLTIRSNVRDARVVITGGSIRGQLLGSAPFTARLAMGTYMITVTAPGHLAAQRQITLNGSQTVNINLESESYSLTVTSNVDDAKVFIKGGNINGQLTGNTNMSVQLQQGTYRIKVNAPGYYAEERTVVFNQSTTVSFQLQPRTGRLEIIIPNNMLDYSQPNPANQIRIYDNGSLVNGTSLQLNPGQHTIRITSGGLAAQQTINVRAGESYRIELNFGFALIKQ